MTKLTDGSIPTISRSDISSGDISHIVDISDTAQDPAGSSKKYTFDAVINPLSEVVINRVEDFAVQDGTTITLEEGKIYIPGAPISTSKRFILEPGCGISGKSGTDGVLWEYTGTGSMFTGGNLGFFSISNLNIRCQNAQAFEITDTSPLKESLINIDTLTLSADGANFACTKFGTFTDIQSLSVTSTAAVTGLGAQDGISMAGASSILSIGRLAMLSTSATYIGLDLGTATLDTAFEILNFVNIGTSVGSIGFSGLAGSGNIGTGIVGVFRDCEFIGAITPLQNLSRSDIQIEFINCQPIQDSTKAVDVYLNISRQVTNPGAGVYTDIDGTDWLSDESERFTTSTGGIATYQGLQTIDFYAIGTATVEKSGGGTDVLAIRVAKNGSSIVKSEAQTENASPTAVTSMAITTLSTGDTLSLQVANQTSSTTPGGDPVVSRANLSGFVI